MPIINVYLKDDSLGEDFQKIIPDLKKYTAEKLTCDDLALTPSEISVRFLSVVRGEMIGEVELEISAHAFSERVEKQDTICLEIMNYLQKETGFQNIKVWLKLSELGHSW